MSEIKKLERSRDDRVIAGVCGGLAKYLGLDASLVRIATVVTSAFTGVGLIVYIVAALVVPEEGSGSSFWKDNVHLTNKSGAADPTRPDGPIYGQDTDLR